MNKELEAIIISNTAYPIRRKTAIWVDHYLIGKVKVRLCDQSDKQLSNKLWNRLNNQLRDQMWNQLRYELRNQLKKDIENKF